MDRFLVLFSYFLSLFDVYGLYFARLWENCDYAGIYFREWLKNSRNGENFYPRKFLPLKQFELKLIWHSGNSQVWNLENYHCQQSVAVFTKKTFWSYSNFSNICMQEYMHFTKKTFWSYSNFSNICMQEYMHFFLILNVSTRKRDKFWITLYKQKTFEPLSHAVIHSMVVVGISPHKHSCVATNKVS